MRCRAPGGAAAAGSSALWAASICLAIAWPAAGLADVRARRPIAAAAAASRPGHQSRLVLAQLQAAASEKKPGAQHEKLYRVELSFDIQEMRGSDGLTMVFDKKDKVLRLNVGIETQHGLAWGRFDDHIGTTGWSELYIETTSHQLVSNDVRTYSAGYIEGVLTAVRISEFNANTRHLLLRKDETSDSLASVVDVFKKQLRFLKEKTGVDKQTMGEEPSDPYDKHIRYSFFQLWGLCDGYNDIARYFQVHELGLVDLLLLNAAGELPQLMEAYSPEATASRESSRPSLLQRGSRRSLRRSWKQSLRQAGNLSGSSNDFDDAHWERRVATGGRCSALVRIAENNQDLLMGHTTWDDYSKMTRIFKYYKIFLDGADTMASHIALSSYPGVLSSTDDFYTTDSGLAIMETSLIVLDPLRWDHIMETPSVPNFMHILAVTRLASSGPHWVQLYASANTGTYTSQWMIVDYNQFKVGTPIPDNAFWVMEVVPGAMHAEDMSNYLRIHGYWPSFNRPFFGSVRSACGYDKAMQNYGALYSWTDNPRAKIFAAHAPEVNALSEMRQLMAQNKHTYQSGPGSPGHEISARMDLSSEVMAPNGGIDAKIVNFCLMKALDVQAISGPSHTSLAPFRWLAPDGREEWPGFPHVGLPTVWNFSYVQMTPVGQGTVADSAEC